MPHRPDSHGVSTAGPVAHDHGDGRPSTGRGGAWLALAICIAVQLTCDLLQTAFRGAVIAPGYPLLIAGLTLAAAVPVGLIASVLPHPLSVALGLWAFAEFTLFAPGLAPGLPVGALVGVATWLGLRRARPTAVAAGIGLAACLWLGLVAAPPLALALPGPYASFPGWAAGAFVYLVTGAMLVALARAHLFGAPAGIVAPALALAALLAVVAVRNPEVDRSAFERRTGPTAAGQPNLLVLVLDTLRADHVSLYGYERETTPQLERWAARRSAAVFPRAYSPSSWTAPAHLSLFTGTLPSEHQAHCGNEAHLRRPVIDPPETLAERLATAGFRSAAVIANPNAMSVAGSERGFDLWMLAPPPYPLSFLGEALRRRLLPLHYRGVEDPLAGAETVNSEVLSLLDHCNAGGCLVVANYIDVHAPYRPSAPFAGRFNRDAVRSAPSELRAGEDPQRAVQAMAAYDEELLGLDAALGELFAELASRGFFEAGWVFVTSDHGEAFLEHDSVHHASSLYDEQIRIPLVVFYPDGVFVPERRDPVGLLDVTATLSAIATGAALGGGRDLRDREAPERAVQAEFYGCPHPAFDWGPHTAEPARAVIRGDRKLLEIGGRFELYALNIDPGERRDRSEDEPATVDRLSAELPPLELRNDRVREQGGLLDPRNAEALRALGYIE
jgi:arylsulfatase A-like enzyme